MAESASESASDTMVYLADSQRLLSLFTQGLAGRYLHLKPSDTLTGHFRPEGTTTDGTSIFLPSEIDDFDVARHNLGVYKVAILHQLGFYEFGTFDFDLAEAERRLAGWPDDTGASLPRAVALETFFDRFPVSSLARRLFLMLEDYRVDCRLVDRFPGIRADLQRVMARALALREPITAAPSAFADSMEGLLQFTLGADVDALLADDATGLLPNLLSEAAALASFSTTVYDTAQATLNCYRLLWEIGFPRRTIAAAAGDAGAIEDALGPLEENAMDDYGSTGSAPFDESALDITGPAFRGELQPDLIQKQIRLQDMIDQLDNLDNVDFDAPPEALDRFLKEQGLVPPEPLPDGPDGESVDGQAPTLATPRPQNADALAKLVRDESGELKRRVQLDQASLRRAFGDDVGGGARSFLYDEWDSLSQVYLKGWCRLFEHRLTGDNFDYFREVKDKHRMLSQRIKNQFRLIKAESFARVTRVSDGEDIDLDALLEAVIDIKAGRTPDDNVYSRRDRSRREVAAAFLLDMSASTDDPVPDPNAPPPEPLPETQDDDPFLYGFMNRDGNYEPEPERRRVIDVEKEALALMSEALETLGDSYGIYGFSGYGRDEVEFYVAKEFEEGLNAKTKSALAAMKPRRSTRMGPAIRHAIKKLERQDVPLKVMIILSDGFPQDCDYGPDRTDHEYGIQDTARALQEAHHRGIQTFCITVDQSGHDYLRRMCPDNRYLIIEEIESLPDQLGKIYRSLTQ